MKAVLLLSFMLFSLSALADTLVCVVEADGDKGVGYSDGVPHRTRAFASSWACDGSIKGNEINVLMYEPHLQVDGERYETSGPAHRSVTLETKYSKCTCSLM